MPNTAPFQRSNLPQIQRFLAGLVTNRNPLDTPMSIQGQNTILHHDVLNDGHDTENSAYDTLVRRPGWSIFKNLPAADLFSYKDLNGHIDIFQDTGSSLLIANTESGQQILPNSPGAGPWTLAGHGNFVYASNGVDQVRIQNTTPQSFLGWGQPTPQVKPVITLQSLNYYNGVTGFIPTADVVAGNLVISDAVNSRTMTVTINSTSVHFNITYTGGKIIEAQSYTQNTVQTQTGTAPNTTTNDVVTVVNNYANTFTLTGITNGNTNYYPNTGTTTVDFDMAYSGSMTLTKLQGLIALAATYTYPGGSSIPGQAIQFTQPFVTATIVHGVWHNPGQLPASTNTAIGMNITGFSSSNAPVTALVVASGLYDVSNPQLSLNIQPGVAPRLYQHISPSANLTDTFTGTLGIILVDQVTNPTTLFTFTNQTMAQIASGLASTYWTATLVSDGSTGYIQLRNFKQNVSEPATNDQVLVIYGNTLVDNSDANLNFANWTFLESNDYPQVPQQGIQIAYGIRDLISGGITNMSQPVQVVAQTFPSRWILSIPSAAPLPAYQALELYRTVDGGSSYLYEQLAASYSSGAYFSDFSITDAGLNEGLVGAINEENDPPPQGLTGITWHTSRFWGFAGNKLYYAGGPDTVNGNGDESWPPGNFFSFPGTITSIMSNDTGLYVALADDLHIVLGVDSSSYYSKPWLTNFGISNINAWVNDGSDLYVYTSLHQLWLINTQGAREIGFDIGDQLLAHFDPAKTNLTFHRNGAQDTALYISNGVDTIYRYNPAKHNWSTKQLPLITAGRVKSLEIAAGNQSLINSVGATGAFFRNTSTWADNGVPYTASATIGVMQVAPPGMRESLVSIAIQAQLRGTLPIISVLLNEIIGTTQVPFLRLFNPVNDPPTAPQSVTLFQKRWYVEQTLSPFPGGTALVNLVSVKIDFVAENVQNEVLGIYLRDKV